LISKIVIAAFLIVVISPMLVFAAPGSVTVDISGTSYDVNFDAEGVEILEVQPDLDEILLLIFVDVSSSTGILEITLDRDFFDSTFEDMDDEFFVIADGDYVDYAETDTNPETRTLRIELPAGTEEVEIFGTVLGGLTFGSEAEPVQAQPPIEPETPTETPTEQQPPEEEEPILMIPTEETPELEEETPETPAETETPTPTQCGPGTVLKDGACVLDEKCGPGTHFEDGTCVADARSSLFEGSTLNQLLIGGGIAFGIALGVMIIFGLIGRASQQKPIPR